MREIEKVIVIYKHRSTGPSERIAEHYVLVDGLWLTELDAAVQLARWKTLNGVYVPAAKHQMLQVLRVYGPRMRELVDQAMPPMFRPELFQGRPPEPPEFIPFERELKQRQPAPIGQAAKVFDRHVRDGNAGRGPEMRFEQRCVRVPLLSEETRRSLQELDRKMSQVETPHGPLLVAEDPTMEPDHVRLIQHVGVQRSGFDPTNLTYNGVPLVQYADGRKGKGVREGYH